MSTSPDREASADRIITRFDADSTAAEVAAGVDLGGLRAVVTGGASGIGAETVRRLAGAGAEVTLAVRDVAAGEAFARDGGTRSLVARLDLADPASVAAFADGWKGPLHLLVNNAGVMRLPRRTLTAAGVELQFATNHLGHYLLATRLHGALAAGAADRGEARIVAVSSRASLDAPVDFDDINFERRPYDPGIAYGQSKTANVLFAVEATRRWHADGVVANAVNPGGVATNLQRHLPDEAREAMHAADQKSIGQGAATTLVAAIARPSSPTSAVATWRTERKPRLSTTPHHRSPEFDVGRWTRRSPSGCGRSRS